MKYIKPFKKVNKDSVAEAGGKGASLGEMTQAGFAVPAGFVILASAYEKFLELHPRSEDIEAQLKKVNPEDMNSVEKASVVIQDIIHDYPIPEELSHEFEKAFDELGAEFVAVRSSATAEDSEIASWAGELDTFLNTTRDTYLDNVKKCWASLFSPRAIFYRHENKLEDAKVLVAVVAQKMINSEIAGVAFSVHPVTKDRNQLIIEAGFGLGETLVSGQITPDSYVIAKDTQTLMDIYISTQKHKLIRDKNGKNKTVELSEKDGSKQKLPQEMILKLAAEVIKIEEHYGFPVDIEWAVEKNKLYITQARPITTL
ncbi:PEP/pyruvate-binding domain-containing protein [Patescibacteria group bacterium]